MHILGLLHLLSRNTESAAVFPTENANLSLPVPAFLYFVGLLVQENFDHFISTIPCLQF
jgi:hypothetical protein